MTFIDINTVWEIKKTSLVSIKNSEKVFSQYHTKQDVGLRFYLNAIRKFIIDRPRGLPKTHRMSPSLQSQKHYMV